MPEATDSTCQCIIKNQVSWCKEKEKLGCVSCQRDKNRFGSVMHRGIQKCGVKKTEKSQN